jgi:transmembrane secretion effector
MPTNQALLPNLVPRERLLNAVALNQLMQQGARMFGPLCILPIIRFVNPEPAFFMSACLYAVGWLQILTIRTASRGTIAPHQGIFGNLAAGIRYIYAQPLILPLMLLTVLHCALTMAYEAAFPFVARTQLGLSTAKDLFAGPTYLMIGVGAGAVLGNLALARVGNPQRRGHLLLYLGFLSGLTPMVLGFARGGRGGGEYSGLHDPQPWHYPDPGPGRYPWPRDERQYLARAGRNVWFQRHQWPANGCTVDDGAPLAARDRFPLRGHHAG